MHQCLDFSNKNAVTIKTFDFSQVKNHKKQTCFLLNLSTIKKGFIDFEDNKITIYFLGVIYTRQNAIPMH